MVRLLYASSKDADLLYCFPHWIADPVLLIEEAGVPTLFLDQREYGIAKELALPGLQVAQVESYYEEARKNEAQLPFAVKVMLVVLKEKQIEAIQVSGAFPYGFGKILEEEGIKITVVDPLFPERRTKKPEEIHAMEEVQRATEDAFAWIKEVLTQSTIQENGELFFQGAPLTSEWLKEEVELLLMKKKAILAEGIIISHGAQAAIPHHAGSGVIKAHEAIVCDIFPRGKENFYFADMTRTFCKGTPSEELQHMYDAVKEAQEKAISMIKPGASGKTIHEECHRIFTERGFVTTREEGFTHSTGHGVGLEIHESPPRISFAECIFLPGDVVTVEPGLYYPAFGGVRIEDMVLVTEDGHRNLTQFEKILFIP